MGSSIFGECFGYSNEPCPECGRYRLENYSYGMQVCEKCHWCPQEGRYVESEELYPAEEYRGDVIYENG
jgi:ribosomal protein L37AE/L43A